MYHLKEGEERCTTFGNQPKLINLKKLFSNETSWQLYRWSIMSNLWRTAIFNSFWLMITRPSPPHSPFIPAECSSNLYMSFSFFWWPRWPVLWTISIKSYLLDMSFTPGSLLVWIWRKFNVFEVTMKIYVIMISLFF